MLIKVHGKKWDVRFLALANHIAGWSRDPSTQVGAVIVRDNRIVVGLGYNGFPRGVSDDEARYADRSIKYAMVVHAEANAVLNANAATAGCILYATKFPCTECTKIIIQSGLNRVVCPPSKGTPADLRWAADRNIARMMLEEAGVEISEID